MNFLAIIKSVPVVFGDTEMKYLSQSVGERSFCLLNYYINNVHSQSVKISVVGSDFK